MQKYFKVNSEALFLAFMATAIVCVLAILIISIAHDTIVMGLFIIGIVVATFLLIYAAIINNMSKVKSE